MRIIAIGLVVAAALVAVYLLGVKALPVVGVPIVCLWIAGWLALTRRAGQVRFDLGHPEKGRYLATAAFGLAVGLLTLDSLLRSTAGLLAAFYGLLALLFVLAAVRGVSIRESGILTGDVFIRWDDITSWTCEPGSGTLNVRVRGAGFFEALTAFRPARDMVEVWALPAGVREEEVSALFAERVQASTDRL